MLTMAGAPVAELRTLGWMLGAVREPSCRDTFVGERPTRRV